MDLPRYIRSLSEEMRTGRASACVNVHRDDETGCWKIRMEDSLTGAWACLLVPESVCGHYGQCPPEELAAHIADVTPPHGRLRPPAHPLRNATTPSGKPSAPP